jgi:Ca2+-binding RTX toxin-like protein
VDQALTVKGGAGKDVILGGDGADTITGNGSADTIDIDAGASKVYYTFTDAATAATEAGSAAGTDNDFSAGAVGDKISNFTTGTDKVYVKAAAVTNAIGSENNTLVSIGNGGTVTNAARFVEFTATMSDATMGVAIVEMNAANTSAVAIGDSFVAYLHDGTDGYLYLVEQVSTSNTIAAQDVTLLGQILAVSNVADGDFVSYA